MWPITVPTTNCSMHLLHSATPYSHLPWMSIAVTRLVASSPGLAEPGEPVAEEAALQAH